MERFQSELSRKKFLSRIAGAGLIVFLTPFSSWSLYDSYEKRISEIVAKTIGIDTHNHIDVPLLASEMPGQKVALRSAITKSGLSGIVMTFAVDYQELHEDGQAYERFLNGLTAIDTILKVNRINRSLSLADIKTAHKARTPTIIQSVEGAHFLEGKIERLEIAYKHGLRHLTLLHDTDASVPLGDIFTNQPKWGGLTSFGSDVIKECERLGILVDLSHCDNNTVTGALKVLTKPFIISHTGLNTRLGNKDFLAKMMKPRLISREQAKTIAKANGVIGVWTHLSDSAMEYAENIKAMVEIIGIDQVAIGTDSKMTPPSRSHNVELGQFNKGIKDNKSTNFEKDNHELNNQNTVSQQPGGETTNMLWPNQKKGFYYTLVDSLSKAGYNEKDIEKIGGGNYLRIFNLATTHNDKL